MILGLKTIHRMNCIHIDDTHFHPSPQSRAKNNTTALYTEVVCATTKNIINEKDLNLKQKVLVSFHRTLREVGGAHPATCFLCPVSGGYCVSGQTGNGLVYTWDRLSQRSRYMWRPQLRLSGKPYFLGFKFFLWEMNVTRKCVLDSVKWNSAASERGCEIWSPDWWTRQPAQSICLGRWSWKGTHSCVLQSPLSRALGSKSWI